MQQLTEITKAEWDRLKPHGYTHHMADGTPAILRLIPGQGTCLVPVVIR
jgi:hypothetical protein